jgi:hypothetical protein
MKLHPLVLIYLTRKYDRNVLFVSNLLFSSRTYKQPTIGANFRSELEAANGAHNQTESIPTSNDAAVNTGTVPFSWFFFLIMMEQRMVVSKEILLFLIISAKFSKKISSEISDELPIEEFASG